MRDLDSAVGRLDNILMSVYVIVAALIVAVALVRIFVHIWPPLSRLTSPPPGSPTCHFGDRGWHPDSWSVPCTSPHLAILNRLCVVNFTGLSWLIGGSLQEVLTSIIFLFIKHPFDVGDRVMIATQTYTVKEIRLLSTVFLDANNGVVQAPNNQLNTVVRLNKSPAGVLGTHGLFMACSSSKICAGVRRYVRRCEVYCPFAWLITGAFRCLKLSHST